MFNNIEVKALEETNLRSQIESLESLKASPRLSPQEIEGIEIVINNLMLAGAGNLMGGAAIPCQLHSLPSRPCKARSDA